MYTLFIENIAKTVSEKMGENYIVETTKITKNNGVILDALIIRNSCEKTTVSPTIYLNGYYEDYNNGKDFSAVVDSILSVYHANKNVSCDTKSILDFNLIQNKICFKLINTQSNKELLKDVPNRQFHDLSIVYYIFLDEFKDGAGTILLHNAHINLWGITEEMLYILALNNTPTLLPITFKNMYDTLFSSIDALGMDQSELEGIKNDNFMYVLNNTQQLFGAATILYPEVLEYFSVLNNSDLWLIPSSIHEWIVVKAYSDMDEESLSEMIKEVNATQLSKDEILSDHPYFYSSKLSKITMEKSNNIM